MDNPWQSSELEFSLQISSSQDRLSAIQDSSMESLESRINNMNIDDGPWRQHDQSQPVWGNNGVQPARVWSQMPVQFPPQQTQAQQQSQQQSQQPNQHSRNPWHDINDIGSDLGMKDLGLSSGSSSQWGGPISGGPSDFEKQIWSDPQNDHSFVPPHARGTPGGIGNDWSTSGMQPNAQIWSDGSMGKEPEHFWKHQPPQQPQSQWGAPHGQGMHGWPPRHMGHPNGPPPPLSQGPRGPLMQQQVPDFAGSWGPNGMMRPKQNNMPWGGGGNDQHRLPGMVQRSGGRQQQAPGRYPPGVDVSVPPPMDLQHMGQGMGMRQMPPPGPAHWKGPGGGMGGAPNGGRPPYQQRGGMNHGNAANGGGNLWSQGNNNMGAPNDYNNFPIGAANDDLNLTVWHDPNEVIKKWQRDTGVSTWGDPEKQDERPIRYWLVKEGEDEDLETALARCPVPQKRVGKSEDGGRLAIPLPQKRPIVETGWDLPPEHETNNTGKSEEARWNDLTTTENPWYVPASQTTFSNENTGSWVQGGTIPLNEPTAHNSTQQQLAEMLKFAVNKGYLDISVTMSQNLPPHILQMVNTMISKLPALESVETELRHLVDSVKPPEDDSQNPQRYMNEVQKVEYNRLIIGVTTAKIEVQDLSKKIHRALVEAGIAQPPERQVPTTSEDYHYSFLE